MTSRPTAADILSAPVSALRALSCECGHADGWHRHHGTCPDCDQQSEECCCDCGSCGCEGDCGCEAAWQLAAERSAADPTTVPRLRLQWARVEMEIARASRDAARVADIQRAVDACADALAAAEVSRG